MSLNGFISVNNECNGRASELRCMHENHQRDIIQCLLDMRKDTETLHAICSKMSLKSEREASYMAGENGLTLETRLWCGFRLDPAEYYPYT